MRVLLQAGLAKVLTIAIYSERFTLRTDWPQIAIHLEHVEEDKRRITITLTPS